MKHLLDFRVPNAPRWSTVFLFGGVYHGLFSPADPLTYGIIVGCLAIAGVFKLIEAPKPKSQQTLYDELMAKDLTPKEQLFRKVAIARELTKMYEEVIRGSLKELSFQTRTWKGEITLVIAGSNEKKRKN